MGRCDPIKEEVEREAHSRCRYKLGRRRSTVVDDRKSKLAGAIELELPATIHTDEPKTILKDAEQSLNQADTKQKIMAGSRLNKVYEINEPV